MPFGFSYFPAPLIIFGYIFIEIAAFIFVGGKIGILPCLCLVLLSAMAGLALLRGNMRRFSKYIRPEFWQDESGGRDSAVIKRLLGSFAAVLLILPGLVSSLIGLILLIPRAQRLLADIIRKNGAYKFSAVFSKNSAPNSRKAAKPQEKLIDLEPENYQARDPENSPWRKP